MMSTIYLKLKMSIYRINFEMINPKGKDKLKFLLKQICVQ